MELFVKVVNKSIEACKYQKFDYLKNKSIESHISVFQIDQVYVRKRAFEDPR